MNKIRKILVTIIIASLVFAVLTPIAGNAENSSNYEFEFFYGKDTEYTDIITGSATFYAKYKSSDWEKAYIEACKKRDALSMDDEKYENAIDEVQGILAGWKIFIDNITADMKPTATVKFVLDNDTIEDLNYYANLDQQYYIDYFKYYSAYEATNLLMYDYYKYLAECDKDYFLYNRLVKIKEDETAVYQQNYDKIQQLYLYDLYNKGKVGY